MQMTPNTKIKIVWVVAPDAINCKYLKGSTFNAFHDLAGDLYLKSEHTWLASWEYALDPENKGD